MKVLLVVPDSRCIAKDALHLATPPLGIGYIAGYIREFGNHDVRICDDVLMHSDGAEIARTVEDFSPNVVGISATATPSVYDVYRTARAVKKSDPNILVVVGGAHVTFEDRQVLTDCPEIDVAVRGEGEVTMGRLLEAHERKEDFATVPGLTFRRGTSVARNVDAPFIKDLDSLPYPAYDLIGLPKYFIGGHRVATMVTSRGCPFNCIFCSSSRIVGKTWRGRTPENVMGEIRLLQHKYKVKEIEFLDDLFTFDSNRVNRICKLLREHGSGLKWTCSTRADILARHPEIAGWLKSAGCNTIYIGIESGSQRILNIIRKGIRLDQVEEAVRIAKEAGLRLVLSFILGFPDETKQELEATINAACRLDPDVAQFTICTPYPGTPLYDEANQNGWLTSHNWKDYSILRPVMNLQWLAKNTLERYFLKAYLRFYLRPPYLWKAFKQRNIFLLKEAIRSVMNYVKRSKA